jgi:hypothetical protein
MPRTRKATGKDLPVEIILAEPLVASPAITGGEPPDFISVTISSWNWGTYLAVATDARQDGVRVELFIARHLRKCAEAGGYSV